MGLDISHGAWHGAYSAFDRWRHEIAKAAGFPPLDLMEGFYEPLIHTVDYLSDVRERQPNNVFYEQLKRWSDELPISWDLFERHPLTPLLYHSDCDGEITYGRAKRIADALEKLLPKLEGDFGGHIGDIKVKTQEFIDGCREAYDAKESLRFG